jgi:GT2 family glycosyltransferase
MTFNLAVLLTCHNRRDKTLACLEALLPQNDSLQVYLVDDGSTDGTGAAVQTHYPQVKVIPGNGNLFWNGGMSLAFATAMQSNYDYYLWLNDDTLLYPDAISRLLETAQQHDRAIVVGAVQDPQSGILSYGGYRRAQGWHPLKFELVPPQDTAQPCLTFNGNCVLVPRSAVEAIGNLDPSFTHSTGDLDYGLRFQQQGGSVWLAPGFLGNCEYNPLRHQAWEAAGLSLRERWHKINQPRGLPMREWQVFARRHAGVFWRLYWLLPYVRLVLKSLGDRVPTPKPEEIALQNTRIALLLPTVELGAYWQPVLRELAQRCPQTLLYTGRLWPDFDPHSPGSEFFQLVGKTKPLSIKQVDIGYDRAFILASPGIIFHLLRFKPHVVFASSYSVWTIFALLLKPFCGWRLVIAYEGSSPNVDFRDSQLRTVTRKLISRFADTFITNSHRGKEYLVEVLNIEPTNIVARPYLVPHSEALLSVPAASPSVSEALAASKTLVFLYVGRLEPRKGIHLLLESCALLRQRGCNFKLQIIGTGAQRQQLVDFVEANGLENYVEWVGWVDYGNLGQYFTQADAFVFPTLEDTWGMVAMEAMALGKPILCSQWAGGSELVVEGENGYVFDPHVPEQLAALMAQLINHPNDIPNMGQKSQQIMAHHTPKDAAEFFIDTATSVLSR